MEQFHSTRICLAKRTREPFAPTTHAQHIRNFDQATQYASLIQYTSSNILEPDHFSGKSTQKVRFLCEDSLFDIKESFNYSFYEFQLNQRAIIATT